MKLRGNQAGFTLIEVMIAFALLAVILASVFITQTSSLSSTGRAKNVLVATNLARNFINEREVRYEGMALDKLSAKQEGTFPAPHENYRWKIEITEIDFSSLADMMAKQNAGEGAGGDPAASQGPMVAKLFEEYMKKSVRRMAVTVEYPDAGSHSSLTFTQLLVNYNEEFGVGI